MTAVLGLDLSLTASGFATPDGRTGTIASKLRGVERLVQIRNVIGILAQSADVAILESYAFARAMQAHQIGELGGVVRVALHEAGIPFVAVAPASLKRFATGKGAATKDMMIAAAIRHFGFEGSTNDEADAWLLRAMGLAYFDGAGSGDGLFPAELASYQRDALNKVQWPVLSGEASARG